MADMQKPLADSDPCLGLDGYNHSWILMMTVQHCLVFDQFQLIHCNPAAVDPLQGKVWILMMAAKHCLAWMLMTTAKHCSAIYLFQRSHCSPTAVGAQQVKVAPAEASREAEAVAAPSRVAAAPEPEVSVLMALLQLLRPRLECTVLDGKYPRHPLCLPS